MAFCCQDTNFGPRMNDLLLALETAFEACGRPVCRSFITAAQPQYVAYDDCCSCATAEGYTWVAVGRTTPMNEGAAGTMSCTTPFESAVQIGIARCAATVDSQGNPPDPDLVSLQGLQALVDRKIMYSAVSQWITDSLDDDIHQVTVGDWVPSVQGGCQIGVIELTYRFEGGCC